MGVLANQGRTAYVVCRRKARNGSLMGEGFQFLDIVFFAMVAAFLVLRLRNVLGRRTGQERPPPADPFGRRKPVERPEETGKVLELPDRGPATIREEPQAGPADPTSGAITQIKIADPSFDLDHFLGGARRAFEMTVQWASARTGIWPSTIPRPTSTPRSRTWW